MQRALLVRHCQTTGQAPGDPLSDEGHAQTEALAAFLGAHPVERILSSPYLRARQSIAPFAERAGLAVTVDERLHERVIAPEPISHWREVVRRAFVDLDHQEPGGESARETRDRGLAALADALDGGDGLSVLVSHGHLLALVLQSFDPGFGFAQHVAMTNPDVFGIARADGATTFRRLWPPTRV